MNIPLRLLWLIGSLPIAILSFPLLPLCMIADLIAWLLTGKNQDIIFKAWDYPPLRWVGRYFDIYMS